MSFKVNLKMIRYDYLYLYLWSKTLYWDKRGITRGAFKNTPKFDRVGYNVLNMSLCVILNLAQVQVRIFEGQGRVNRSC